jgi:hypothetical protein
MANNFFGGVDMQTSQEILSKKVRDECEAQMPKQAVLSISVNDYLNQRLDVLRNQIAEVEQCRTAAMNYGFGTMPWEKFRKFLRIM